MYVSISKQGLPITSDIKDIDSLVRISGRVECESPNRHLYDFVGNIRLDGHGYVKLAFIKAHRFFEIPTLMKAPYDMLSPCNCKVVSLLLKSLYLIPINLHYK